MTPSRDELDNVQLEIFEGHLPDDVQGHVFIVAPVGTVDSGGLPFKDGNSFLNGDGMIYRLDFDRPGKVSLKSRIVKPLDYWIDEATKKGTQFEKLGFGNHGIVRLSYFRLYRTCYA
jgi:carotenoid cleavage dioxygenase-like enzyme